MATHTRAQTQAFERYYTQRLARAEAITPGQKIALINQLRRELSDQGRVPLASGPVRVDPKHPIVRASLEGRAVSLDNKVVTSSQNATISERMQALPVAAKLLILVIIFLLPIILFGTILWRGVDREEAVVVEEETPTPTATKASTPKPTITLTPTQSEKSTATVLPTATPFPTATPYAFSLSEGKAPTLQTEPASLELAGYSYILSTGHVNNGIWEPAGAQWLEGSHLRRIIALPYQPELANTLALTRPGLVIKLRLRSGQLVKYKLAQSLRLQRQQIEVLAEKSPSLAIILYGEASPERTVLIANAVQEAHDFSLEAPSYQPTAIPIISENIITSTQSITHLSAGLTLSIDDCQQVEQIGGQQPTNKKSSYAVCQLTLTALPTTTVSYSQAHFSITDRKSYFEATDWLPPPQPVLSDALGSGQLAPNTDVMGRVAGEVETNSLILVWTQADKRYIIELP